jgi:two-component system, NtrC family, sensor kinase
MSIRTKLILQSAAAVLLPWLAVGALFLSGTGSETGGAVAGDAATLAPAVAAPPGHSAFLPGGNGVDASPQRAITSTGAPAGVVIAAPSLRGSGGDQLAMILLVTTFSFILFYLIVRLTLRPLAQLTAAADAVRQGNFSPPLPRQSNDEIGRLSRSFSTMLNTLHGAVSREEASRQMATIGEFASQLSHEIRNPLTSVKMNLQSLEREAQRGTIPGDLQPPLRVALKEISRLDTVAGTVLRLGRPHTRVREMHSAQTLVTQALEVVERQFAAQGIRVETEFRCQEDVVDVDPQQLVGVFLNLFLNAAEVMPSGGTVDVRTYGTVQGPDRTAKLRIHIGDSGPGISHEALMRIFQPFFTTKEKGSGLGLSIALRTVEDHGGRLFILDPEDARTTGAEFVIELPLADVQLSWLEAS